MSGDRPQLLVRRSRLMPTCRRADLRSARPFVAALAVSLEQFAGGRDSGCGIEGVTGLIEGGHPVCPPSRRRARSLQAEMQNVRRRPLRWCRVEWRGFADLEPVTLSSLLIVSRSSIPCTSRPGSQYSRSQSRGTFMSASSEYAGTDT